VQLMARLEYENLMTALKLALNSEKSIINISSILHNYFDISKNYLGKLEMDKLILGKIENYSKEKLKGRLGAEFLATVVRIGETQLNMKNYTDAGLSFNKALTLLKDVHVLNDTHKKQLSAIIYRDLGIVAQEQRQWEQAEKYFQNALKILIEFNDRYSQASTYHYLGRMAQERQQWKQAEKYYQNALKIVIEFNDRHSQASNYHTLGMVVQEQRQWERAEKYFQNALKILIEFNDRHSQASTYHMLGRVAQKQRQWEQAREYSLRALKIWVEYQDEYHIKKCVVNLAILYSKSKDAELPAALEDVLGISAEEAKKRFLNHDLHD